MVKIYATKFDKFNNENKSDNIKEGLCDLPFIYKNKLYNKCLKTKKGDICATKTKNKKLVKYGYCDYNHNFNKKKN